MPFSPLPPMIPHGKGSFGIGERREIGGGFLWNFYDRPGELLPLPPICAKDIPLPTTPTPHSNRTELAPSL